MCAALLVSGVRRQWLCVLRVHMVLCVVPKCSYVCIMNFISVCPPDYIILHALVNVAVNMGIAMG